LGALPLILLPLLLVVSGGCTLVGLTTRITGDPPIPAEYVPAPRPTVVLVQTPPDPTGESRSCEEISYAIEQELEEHQTVPLVSSVKVFEISSSRPAQFATMSAGAVGRAVAAEQVLLVQVNDSTIDVAPGAGMYKGQIAAFVSFIDAASDEPLWPTDSSAGATVTYSTPMLRAGDQVTAKSVERNLYSGLADRIAKLFRQYKPDE
jgi:hypothetical protein